MPNVRDFAALEAAQLRPGENKTTTCPVCNRAGKFSVGRLHDGTVVYQCFRASCPTSGSLRAQGSLPIAQAVAPKRLKTSPLRANLQLLELDDCGFFEERFGLSHNIVQEYVQRVPERSAYAFDLRSKEDWVMGHQLRAEWSGHPVSPWNSLGDLQNSKARTFWVTDKPERRLSFYQYSEEADTAWIVEDPVSALCVAQEGHCGIALLGTNLNASQAMEIKRAGFERIVVALDFDATDKAHKMVREYRPLWGETWMHPLTEDLKDMRLGEREELLADSGR